MLNRIGTGFLAAAVLGGCVGDETLSGYLDRSATWKVVSIDEVAYPAVAILGFPEPGVIRGTGPCNGFSAEQTAPYPWFRLGPIRSTRKACAEMAAENDLLDALAKMTLSEVSGDVLILSNEAGRSIVLTAVQPN